MLAPPWSVSVRLGMQLMLYVVGCRLVEDSGRDEMRHSSGQRTSKKCSTATGTL